MSRRFRAGAGRTTRDVYGYQSPAIAPGKRTRVAARYGNMSPPAPAQQPRDPASSRSASSAPGVQMRSGAATKPQAAQASAAELSLSRSYVSFPATQIGAESTEGITVTNDGTRAIFVDHIGEIPPRTDSPFMVYGVMSGQALRPGQSLPVTVGFRPGAKGPSYSVLWLKDFSGRPLASFVTVGKAVEAPAPKQPPEATLDTCHPARADVGLPRGPACPPVDDYPRCTDEEAGQLQVTRQKANAAADRWQAATETVLMRSTEYLRSNWVYYLSLTSSSPHISSASLGDSSLVRNMMSNAFGNAINDIALASANKALQKRVGALTAKITGKKLAAAGAGVAAGAAAGGAAVGSIGGPPGAAVGFVVGVLVETAAGLIFDWLAGDAEMKKAARRIYDQGQADGSEATGKHIRSKDDELDQARRKARGYLKSKVKLHKSYIKASCSASEIAALATTANALADQANKAVASVGSDNRIADQLLALWARERAGTSRAAAAGVNASQWSKVTGALSKVDPEHFGKGTIKNDPRLLVLQTRRDWEALGLPDVGNLCGQMAAEIDGILKAMAGRSAAQQASAVKQRLHSREYIWPNGVKSPKLAEGLGHRGPTRKDQIQWAACNLELAVENGACYVREWRWVLRDPAGTGRDQFARRNPRSPGWNNAFVSHARRTSGFAHREGGKARAAIAALRGMGLTVTSAGDARTNTELQGRFGTAVAKPRKRLADDAVATIPTYRVKELVANYDPVFGTDPAVTSSDRKDGQLVSGPAGRPAPTLGSLLFSADLSELDTTRRRAFYMFRGGDTIIYLEYFNYTGPR